ASELMGIPSFASEEFEADDLLGTLARGLRRSTAPIAILSRDKDLGQLLQRSQDYLWDYSKNERLYQPCIQRKFGVGPAPLVDYLALVGDSIDDIPGVPGLGPKTAQALLNHYENIDVIFESLDALHELPIRGAKSLADKLLAHQEQIAVSRRLARIVDDVPLAGERVDLRWTPALMDIESLAGFCERMGFPRLVARIESFSSGTSGVTFA